MNSPPKKRKSQRAAGFGANLNNGPARLPQSGPATQRPRYLVVFDLDWPRVWCECDDLAAARAARDQISEYLPGARVLMLRRWPW